MRTLEQSLEIINAASIGGDSREENIFRELRNLIEDITDKYENPENLSDEKIDLTDIIKKFGYSVDEYRKFFGSTERSERDVVENLANMIVEKGYAADDGNGKPTEPKKKPAPKPEPKPQPTSDDEARARRIRIAKAKAKAAMAMLELMALDGVSDPTLFDGLDVAAPRQTTGVQGQLDDVREHFKKHWDAKRGEYVYTDFDGDQWYKNRKGHFCLLNGCNGDDEPRFTFDWEGRVAYIYGFAPDEYEAARDFCAEKVDEKVMRGSGWHFGASGYDARTQSWRFFIFYGAMAAGVNGANSGTRDEYEEYLNEVGESLLEEDFIIGGKDRRPMPYGTALRRYDKTTFNVGYNEWKQENEWRQNHQFNGCDGNYDDISFLKDRFPDNEADVEHFVTHNWDDGLSRYENLKAFKEWLDNNTDDIVEGGDLFETSWTHYGNEGVLTPLYNINELYGEDYDFAHQWLQETLEADGYSIDRFLIDDFNNRYFFIVK